MCFEPDSKKRKPKKNWGYKVFGVGKNGELRGDFASRRKERKRNIWLNEKDFKPTRSDLQWMGKQGHEGWGVFLFKEDAMLWVGADSHFTCRANMRQKVVRVKVRNILKVGKCCGLAVILVKEIFIPNE